MDCIRSCERFAALAPHLDEELAKFVEIEETRYDENSEVEQHYKYR